MSFHHQEETKEPENVYVYYGEVTVPKTVTRVRVDASIKEIRATTFRNCRQLEFVELPEGLKEIGNGAFESCLSLMHVEMASTLVDIRDRAFMKCVNLKFLHLPETLETIGTEAFAFCESLRKIKGPSTLRSIGDNAFLNCEDLVCADFEEGLLRIGEDAFCGCTSLQKMRVPSTVNEIEDGTFSSCSSLVSLEVAKGLQTIGDYAFNGCTNLRNIAISTSVTRVGRDAFANCDALADQTGAPTDRGIVSALKKRFEALPIHELCYYQSYYPTLTLMENLKKAFQCYDSVPSVDGQALFDLTSGDACLGMTPLGILSMSAKPDFAFAKGLISVHSVDQLSQKDKSGFTAYDYLCLNNSSASLKLVKFTVQQIVYKRIDAFTLEKWKLDILKELNEIPKGLDATARRNHISRIYTKVDDYEFMEDL
jgi:hypothetical protein